jgi:hypothetical protein
MDRVNIVILSLLVLLFVVWFYGPWQTLCVDWARERMFEARNALFDIAVDKRVSFTSLEYRELRHRIEVSIRFAHRTSWPRILLFFLFTRNLALRKPTPPEELIVKLPDDTVRRDARHHINTVTWTIIRLIVFRSVILLAIFGIVWILWQCGAPVYRFCKDFAENLARAVQDDALAVGDEETAWRRPHVRKGSGAAKA